MAPSAHELVEGRKAYERVEGFQRYRGGTNFFVSLVILVVGGVCAAFQRGGWKPALGTAAFWLIVSAISTYQFRQQQKRAEIAATFLAQLKARYGVGVYATIAKQRPSLFYRVFLKRFPPFNRPVVKLP